LVAVETLNGVVIATDSRTSQGSYIASRITNKINSINDHIVVMRSGKVSDSQAIFDVVKYYSEANSFVFLDF
jgi:20S proteasome subunit beta 1